MHEKLDGVKKFANLMRNSEALNRRQRGRERGNKKEELIELANHDTTLGDISGKCKLGKRILCVVTEMFLLNFNNV